MSLPFRQVDVFGDGPFAGNPVAVVHDADHLTTERMRAISRWTNLSECTFLLAPQAPEADYRVRIFNLDTELPFAGHPTLGTARAWLEAGGVPRDTGMLVQECGIGPVKVRATGDHLAFAAPPLLRSGTVGGEELQDALAVLGVDADAVVAAAWVDNGPGWIGILLPHAADVLALEPDVNRRSRTGRVDIGVVGPHSPDAGPAFEVRAFFSDDAGQLREDPVTGSLNASLAQWLVATGRATAPYTVSQGTRLGRRGRVRIEADGGELWIGGRTTVPIAGEIDVWHSGV